MRIISHGLRISEATQIINCAPKELFAHERRSHKPGKVQNKREDKLTFKKLNLGQLLKNGCKAFNNQSISRVTLRDRLPKTSLPLTPQYPKLQTQSRQHCSQMFKQNSDNLTFAPQ